ncbi:CD209 antigen-like protein E [Chironomus tepperi]|uniref:CD209 antigen-like protein E n=1 Tax=Chironomus tepperi TaxID=113505 RepID=UPI00391F837B
MGMKILIFASVLLWMTLEESTALHIKTPHLDVNLEEIGRYSGQDSTGTRYSKSYFISRNYQSNWEDAKAICKLFNLELATFETLHEANSFFNLPNVIQDYVFVDGTTTVLGSPTEWYWTNKGERKIAYALPWDRGEPNNAGIESCLTVIKHGKIGFNDLSCWTNPKYFICQRND